MTYEQLEHAIRAACTIADDDHLIIFGSQAILGTYPHAPEALRSSIEVDVQPLHRPEKVDDIDGAIGELSSFHQTHGFYVHGVSVEAAILPPDWLQRTVVVRHAIGTRGNTGHCLEAHDLAASKLAAFREKDRAFVRTLLAERLIDPVVLQKRLMLLPLESSHTSVLQRWLERTMEEFD